MKRKERKPSFCLSSGTRKDVIKVFFIFPNSLLTSAAPLSRASNLHTRQITKIFWTSGTGFSSSLFCWNFHASKCQWSESLTDWKLALVFFHWFREDPFSILLTRGNAENLLLSLFLFSSASPSSSKPMLTAAASGMKEKKERQTHLQTPLLLHLCRRLPFLPPPTSISPTWEWQWTYNQARESTTFDFWDDSDNVNIFSENCAWVSKLILKYISNW